MAITKATASSIAPAAKGDLVAGSGTNDAAVLTVGANGTTLVADSSTSTGLKWAAPAGFTSVGNVVLTEQSTTSTSYTDLSTSQSVTLTTGTKAIIFLTCEAKNGTVAGRNRISVAVSGSSSIAASDDYSAIFRYPVADPTSTITGTFFLTGLTAGSNTFTMKFKSVDGTTASFQNRYLIVADMGS
jgi:hypothetical protein